MIRINKDLVDYVNQLYCSKINDLVTEEKIVSKELIIEQGKRIFSVYIIKSGIAKCYTTQDTGMNFIQEFFGEGGILGEIEMFNNDASFSSIEAVTNIAAFKIRQDNFHFLLNQDKVFNQLILKALASKIKDKAIRHSHNQSHTIKSNFLRLKKSFPNLNEMIPKKDVANYLGITERSLNRTLNDLKEE